MMMFDKLIGQVKDAIADLRRMRAGAQEFGFSLEEINIRILHLENSVKKIEAAKADFMTGAGEIGDDTEDAEDDEDYEDFEDDADGDDPFDPDNDEENL